MKLDFGFRRNDKGECAAGCRCAGLCPRTTIKTVMAGLDPAIWHQIAGPSAVMTN
jgi:hypothetical protein